MPTTYEILDPRPLAASAKYTYFLPAQKWLDSIGKDDLVKAIFRAIPASEEWDAERMWVKVTSVEQDWLEGILDSEPLDLPALANGNVVRIPRTHVIAIVFEDPEKDQLFSSEPRREFWARCWVDRAVLDGELLVQYLYREEPEPTPEDERFPDSGWRIRGDMRFIGEEDLTKREIAYVALGAVLNKDDSWLHLIDEAVGSAFDKDFDTGTFFRAP